MAIPQFAGGIPQYNAAPEDLVDPAAAAMTVPVPAMPEASAVTGKRVDVVNSKGEAISIDESELPKAEKLGYQVETPEQRAVRVYTSQHSGLSGDLIHGLGQFANEGSFGASGAYEKATDDPLERAKKEALAKQHKIAGIIGGALGFGASLLYGGEFFDAASGAARLTEAGILGGERALEAAGGEAVGEGLARLVPEGAEAAARKAGPGFARKLIASGAGHAVEGAVFAAPKALTEASLGDPDEAAETLLYGAGLGALIGVAGPAKNEIERGFSAAADSVTANEELNSKIASKLADFSDKQAIKSFNPLKKWSKKIDGIGESEVASVAKKYNLMPKFGQTAEDVAEQVAAAKSGVGEKIGAIVENASGQAPRVSPDEVANVFNAVAKSYERGEKSLGAEGIRRKLAQMAEDARSAFSTPELGLEGEAVTSGGGLTLEQLDAVRQYLGKNIPEGEKSTGMRQAIGDVYHRLNDMFFAKAESAIEDSGGDAKAILAELRSLKSDYRALVPLSEATKDNIARGLANRGHSITDYAGNMIGGVVGHSLGPGGAVVGSLLGGGVNKVARMYGNTYMSKAADSLAELFGNPAARNPLDVGGLLGIEQAMKHSAEELDAVPGVLSGEERKSALETLPEHAAIDFVNAFRGKASSESKMDSFKTLADEITSLTADPSKLQTRMTALLAPYTKDASTIAGIYGAKAVNAITYLQQTMPKDRYTPNPFAPREWKPTETDLSGWARRWEGVLDPFSVVARVTDGTLSRADVETVQRVYPKLYDRMRKAVVEYGMSPDVKSMPYAQRLKLSMLMQTPIDPSMQNVGALQSLFTQHPESEDAAKGKPGGKSPGPPHAKVDPTSFGGISDVQRIASK